MRVKKADYFLGEQSWNKIFGEDAEYFYISIIHLDHRFMNSFADGKVNNVYFGKKLNPTLTSISNAHPYKVKKGEVIGKVGSIKINGGWSPHAHIEVHRSGSKTHDAIDKYGNLIYNKDGTVKQERTGGIYDERVAKYNPTFDEATGTWKANLFDAKATGVNFVSVKEDPLKDPNFTLSQNKYQVVDPNNIFNYRKYSDKNPVVILDNP